MENTSARRDNKIVYIKCLFKWPEHDKHSMITITAVGQKCTFEK